MLKQLALSLALFSSVNISALSVSGIAKNAGRSLHHLVAEGFPVSYGLAYLYKGLMADNLLARSGCKEVKDDEFTQEASRVIQELGMDPSLYRFYQFDASYNDRLMLKLCSEFFAASPVRAIGNAIVISPISSFRSREWIFAKMGQELMSIKNKDAIKIGLVYLVAPIIAHFGSKRYTGLAQRGFDALGIRQTGVGTIAHTLFSLHQFLMTSAVGKYGISCYLGGWYARMCAARADRQAAKLRGCASVKELGCGGDSCEVFCDDCYRTDVDRFLQKLDQLSADEKKYVESSNFTHESEEHLEYEKLLTDTLPAERVAYLRELASQADRFGMLHMLFGA